MEVSEIKDLLEKKEHAKEIANAIVLQNEMQFFTMPFNGYAYAPAYMSTFQQYLKDRFNNVESVSTFNQHTTYPYKSVGLSNKINSELSKIFKSEDRIEKFIFKNYENKEVAKYVQDYTFEYSKEIFWDKFIKTPNDLFFITFYEEKYYVAYKSISDLLAIKYSFDNDIECVILQDGKEHIIVIDEYRIERFSSKDGYSNIESTGEILQHDLKFCPCDFVSNKKYTNSKVIRKNHFYDYLGDIREFHINSVIGNIHDSMSFAHEIKYKDTGCEYRIGSEKCTDGLMYVSDDEGNPMPVILNGIAKKCPICNTDSKSFGTNLNIKLPRQLDGLPAIDSMIKYLFPDTQILEYSDKKLNSASDHIFNSILGVVETLNNAQQHNEQRILSTYESKQLVILNWKKVFEFSSKMILDSILKMQYKDLYVRTIVDYGNDYYLNTEIQTIDLIDKSKTVGISSITNYEDYYVHVKYQNDNSKKVELLTYNNVVRNLKPYYSYSPAQIVSAIDRISDYDFQLNGNFDKLWNNYRTAIEIPFEQYVYDITQQGIINDFKKYIESNFKISVTKKEGVL